MVDKLRFILWMVVCFPVLVVFFLMSAFIWPEITADMQSALGIIKEKRMRGARSGKTN